jgi:hypothetical protein
MYSHICTRSAICPCPSDLSRRTHLASNRLRQQLTLPLPHPPHQQQKVSSQQSPYSRVYGIRLSTRHSTTGMALNSSPKRSASQRAYRGKFSKVRPSHAVSGGRYVLATWPVRMLIIMAGRLASTDDTRLASSNSVCGIHHGSFHGVPTPGRSQALPKYASLHI